MKPNMGKAIRDRVKEFRRVKASELVPSPKNWRTHPDEQQGALRAVLDDVGFCGVVLARELPDGRLEIVDGHLRQSMAGDEEVPVAVLDVDEAEAAKILATFDPISGLAEFDPLKLSALLDEVGDDFDDNAFMRKMIADANEDLAKAEKANKEKEYEVPGLALRPHEHYDFLVVLASSTQEWNVLCERLNLQPQAITRRGQMGISRAIRAEQLINKLVHDK